MDNIFQKRKNTSNSDSSTDLILYKEPGFLRKLFNLVKGIFKKNKLVNWKNKFNLEKVTSRGRLNAI